MNFNDPLIFLLVFAAAALAFLTVLAVVLGGDRGTIIGVLAGTWGSIIVAVAALVSRSKRDDDPDDDG